MKIKDLPSEIQLLAALRTDKNDMKTLASFFDANIGGCFIFIGSIEGLDFWEQINKGNFAPFYERYPDQKPNAGIFPNESSISKESREAIYKAVWEYDKKPENVYPKVMEVRNRNDGVWKKRVVFMEKNNSFIAWADFETLKESEKTTETYTWAYARDIPQKTIITKQDIASKFGVDIDSLEIV